MKKRIDILLTEKKLADTRAKAQALLMAGQVFVDGKIVDKAGTMIDEKSEIEVKEKMPYVSRGALKIEKAYKEFGLNFKDKIICDIGASTGGFTDFSLQNGAKKVYAIDVGYGQLDQKLREDLRVIVMEKTNIKDVKSLPERIDFYVVDVSFISLIKVLPIIKNLICHSCEGRNLNKEVDPRVKPEDDNPVDVIALIKPQFEVGKKIADKNKGVIKDEKIHASVVEDIGKFAEGLGYKVIGLTESPITGAKGNKEFLMWFK